MPEFDYERREFVRVKAEIPVRYKFLCRLRNDTELNDIYEGTTANLSGGGILLVGKIPVLDWIPDLLMQKIVIGVNLFLPAEDKPVKALSRVAWVEQVDENTRRCMLGLKFKEITQEDRDRIFRFVIKVQMPS